MDWIVTFKVAYQVTPDMWEYRLVTRTFSEDHKISQIHEWIKSHKGDINTIELHPNMQVFNHLNNKP